jgi:vacuolar-type H+-ATPase subunit H
MATPRPFSSIASTARHVEQIVQAAEHAAEQLRAEAEQRAADRIAEAERAAMMRIQAAEEEADELRAEAVAAAEGLRNEAAEAALEARHQAQARARELIADARRVAHEVLREGETLSGHLRELSDSLRVNAERLLRDVRDAHSELSARLDRAEPGRAVPGARNDLRAASAASNVPDVPEFIPRHPR